MADKESIRKELNLKNLRRHDPSVTDIIRTTSHVTAYAHKGDGWEKTGVEGPLFVFTRAEGPHGFFILNRNGLEYVKELLNPDCEVRNDAEFILFEPSATAERATGIWIQDEKERSEVCALMESLRQGVYAQNVLAICDDGVYEIASA